MPTGIDYTAVIVAALSLIASGVLGFLQFGKWRAEAKKARTEAQTDLIKVALEINKQENATLREVIKTQSDLIEKLENKMKEEHNEHPK
jgi:hypothetical protein